MKRKWLWIIAFIVVVYLVRTGIIWMLREHKQQPQYCLKLVDCERLRYAELRD